MRNFNEKYTIRDFIDKNKWSNVYQGINNKTNDKIILNIITNIKSNEDSLEKFKKEVNLLKEIDNPNLISIKDMSSYINKDKTYYYIESEYFEGLTLGELRHVSKLHETQCLEIIREVIKGVNALNKKGINYKNLTEENIIINGQGIVKVDTLALINNHQGHLNCKSVYSKKFDKSEDIYNIGSILCDMLTGKKYWDHSINNVELNENIKQILEKSTNVNKKHKSKYKDLNEFLDEINAYLKYGDTSYKTIVNFEEKIKKEHNPNIKKYLAIGVGVFILISTTVFGAKYLKNQKGDNVATRKPVVETKNEDTKEEFIPTRREENLINKTNTNNSNNIIYDNKDDDKDKENTDEDKEQEKEPEKVPENEPEKDPEQEPEKNPENEPEKNPEQEPEKVPENEQEKDPEQEPEKDPENEQEKNPEQEPEKNPENKPQKDPQQDIENESQQEDLQEYDNKENLNDNEENDIENDF